MKPNNSNATSEAHPSEMSIRGTVDFQGVKEPVNNATVHVRLQETSRADAQATTVAEQVINNVNIVPEGPPIPFTLPMPPNENGRYVVRVHADVAGDGKVSQGDYVSTQSYPVDMNAEESGLAIVAKRVGQV